MLKVEELGDSRAAPQPQDVEPEETVTETESCKMQVTRYKWTTRWGRVAPGAGGGEAGERRAADQVEVLERVEPAEIQPRFEIQPRYSRASRACRDAAER